LPFGVTVQEIYSHLEELYTLPPEFLTWLRVINVGKSGKKTPAIYGTVNECKLKVTAVLDNISPDLLNEEPDPLNEEPDELGEGYGDSYSEGEWEPAGGQHHNDAIHAPNIDNGLESYPEEVSTRAARVRAESVEQWGEEVTNLIYGFAESIQREVDNGDIYGDSDSYSGYDLDSDDEDLEGEL
jgi:hypothetical protein